MISTTALVWDVAWESRSAVERASKVSATGAGTEPELEYWRRSSKPRLQMCS